ncbi:MAG TPA: zinc-binding alcohol dehydrogenase family protein [Acidiphilium sp.]|jgi:zinc-binding alcohol dehydrogenase family protein|uniref:zinc-binding alcohol dehydrogenase family protein n=1 Tax=unclassified Acidiphilium TaxID=2617493 RepID=UPI000BCD1CCC|nr:MULTISPECIES: zinc-binding alcohol dehydrogenase family protein [unclassified Acidiphilium]OYV55516.1 MAG: NADPH:quinone reductase [Acidiphilium sp. 20-67-58]HQT61727.1 zinc-binding alcohol dehydrogenase family protein [Acidiphilium sp.]HQU11153.1 zinc-binding alcohol dehydrogenase family protein [Acidiphilium sp.]
MKAVAFTHSLPITADDALIDIEAPDPVLRAHDVLVEIRAVSVNPVDTKIRRRNEPLGEPRILGFDASGIVRAVGPGVTRFGIGDEVFYAGSVDRQGSNAQFQAVDERLVARKPRSLSFAEAAALPLTTLTAWEMLFDRFSIPRDRVHHDTLLIVGGAGGVGSMAIQLARQLTGLVVVATASRPETINWCSSLGAHHVIDHHHPVAAQLEMVEASAPSYIFCTNHVEKHWRELCHVLAPEGRIGLIESTGPLDMHEIFNKSASVHTEYMFARSLHQTAQMIEQHHILQSVSRLVDQEVLRTTMTENYGPITAANLRRAHAAIESGTTRGKIVLEGF